MGELVVVPSFKDKGGVHENGVRRVISRYSKAADEGYINLYDDYDVNIRVNKPPKFTLLLITPDQERIYTDLTRAEWNALVINAGSGTSNTITETFLFKIATAGQYPPGGELVSEDLYNAIQIHRLSISNTNVDEPENIYDPTFSATEGRLRTDDLPSGGVTLVDGDTVRVTLERTL